MIEDEMVCNITNSKGMSLGNLKELVTDKEASCAMVHRAAKSQT